MAYKIEDINWDEMPPGAVEFSLDDEHYVACWYNENGEHSIMGNHNGWHLPIIDPEDPEDNRERYKIIDYHPSTRKPTREERLDKALRALIQTHFVGNDLEWGWKEGNSLEDIDPSLYKEIVDLLK